MVKKLRYLARYIVVSMLLNKSKQVEDLTRDLGKQIDSYVKNYDPEDQVLINLYTFSNLFFLTSISLNLFVFLPKTCGNR